VIDVLSGLGLIAALVAGVALLGVGVFVAIAHVRHWWWRRRRTSERHS